MIPKQDKLVLYNFRSEPYFYARVHMENQPITVDDILNNVTADRTEAFHRLHRVIVENLPKGFEVAISYGGLGHVIPRKIYPAGYHCKPTETLPFTSITSLKNSINL